MIEIVISILLLLYVISGFYNKGNFIYYYIPINFIYDLLVYYLPDNSIFPFIRGFGTFVLLAYLLWKYKIDKNNYHILFVVILLVLQLLILSYFSTNPFKSYSETLKFINISLTFFIGYSFFKRGGDIFKLFFAMKMVLIVLVVNIIIANIFSLGFKGYSGSGFYSGAVFANGWYTPTIAVIAMFILIMTPLNGIRGRIKIKNRRFTIGLLIVSFAIIILGGRRSAVLILTISVITYLYYSRYRLKSILNIVLFAFGLLLISSMYIDILSKQYANRLNLYNGGLQEENRYVETELLWRDMLSFEDKKKSIFGSSPFVTAGSYGDESHTERYLHVDINIVLFSVGFWGLFLYIVYYILIYRLIKSQFKNLPKNKVIYDLNHLKLIVLSIYFSSLALSFSGGFSAITYRSTTFLIIGSILGHLHFLTNCNTYQQCLKD